MARDLTVVVVQLRERVKELRREVATWKARARLAEDKLGRLIVFDGGAELRAAEQMHRLHAEEPYIGCVFCQDAFVPKARLDALVNAVMAARSWLDPASAQASMPKADVILGAALSADGRAVRTGALQDGERADA